LNVLIFKDIIFVICLFENEILKAEQDRWIKSGIESFTP